MISPARLVGRIPFPYRAAKTPLGVERVTGRPAKGPRYDTEWARRYPARVARLALLEGVVRPTIRVLADPTRTGQDRLDDLDGPVIFAANHHSHLDTTLLLSSIPEPWRHRMVVGAAADYFFSTRVTSALSALAIGAIPIDRTKVNRRSSDQAAALIADGWSLIIFPEGGRSPDGWGQPFRGGAAYLAARCRVPVVPVHLAGTGRILGKGMSRPRPGRTRVTFGRPIHPGPDDDARTLGPQLEEAVTALADEAAHGWYEARLRAHTRTSPGLTGPETSSWRRAWALPDRRRRRRARRWPDLS